MAENLRYYQVDRNVASSIDRPHVWQPSENPAISRTILLLHGTGANERDLLGLGKLLDPTANLLSPRGLVVSGGMARYFLRFENGDFDEDGIRASVDDLSGFVADAAEHYGFDANNVWIAGFSNGATAGGALLLRHSSQFKGLFAFGTTKSFKEPSYSKLSLAGKHIFIANGAQDPYAPEVQTTALIAEFERLGAKVKLLIHPGGHNIVGEHVRAFAQDLQSL